MTCGLSAHTQPCISVGNVGQLAVDLLINSLRLGRVGYLHDPSLLPLVGNDAFDHTPQSGHLHTAAEGQSSLRGYIIMKMGVVVVSSA